MLRCVGAGRDCSAWTGADGYTADELRRAGSERAVSVAVAAAADAGCASSANHTHGPALCEPDGRRFSDLPAVFARRSSAFLHRTARPEERSATLLATYRQPELSAVIFEHDGRLGYASYNLQLG